jgi:hypothetical protein
MLIKVRLFVLGLLSVMAFGAVASTAALANPGPFWWHRNNSKEGAGVKLAEGSIEQYKGAGEAVTFKSEEGGVSFTMAAETQIKGDIWNEPNQGQIKAQVTFQKVHFIEPAELNGCKVTVTVPQDYVGHLMWKYRGNKEELSQEGTQESHGQKWDVVLYPVNTRFVLNKENELEEKNTFAEIKPALEKACGALGGLSLKPKGVTGFADKALHLEEFAKKTTIEFPGHEVWQHFWNGKEVATLKGAFEQGTHPDFWEGTLPIEFAKQEIDIHEK